MYYRDRDIAQNVSLTMVTMISAQAFESVVHMFTLIHDVFLLDREMPGAWTIVGH
jgi:hypothetical protein